MTALCSDECCGVGYKGPAVACEVGTGRALCSGGARNLQAGAQGRLGRCCTCLRPLSITADHVCGHHAACENCYDGAPDSRSPIGWGLTPADAVQAYAELAEVRQ